MKLPRSFARLKGFRFPREIIAYAVWAYHRFAMSTADVEDLLAERGILVSRETVRLWVNRFGRHFVHPGEPAMESLVIGTSLATVCLVSSFVMISNTF